MKGTKVLIKLIKSSMINNKVVFECEEVETGQKVLLKKSPKIMDTQLRNNTKYFMLINENWINQVEPFEEVMDEKPKIEEISMTEFMNEVGVPKDIQKKVNKTPISPYDIKNAGAKIGGLMHDVVQLAAVDKNTSEEYLEEKLKMLIRLSEKYTNEVLR